MGLDNFFRKMFTTNSTTKASSSPPVEYNGYSIQATPQPQGGQYITAGIIRKQFADEIKEQRFIRADTHMSAEGASEHAIRKGKQIIDEQGERLFES